ncbi:MAG: TetR/AcrR family transcriptional regulator, partial [Lysinibacillus sp.]
MNKNDLRVRKTKQNIHKSLLFILKSKPLSHIKITELCKEASINRGTFYFHYEDVGAVFEEIFQEAMYDLQESYEQPYRKGFGDGSKSLDPQTIQIFHHVKKYEDFYKVVLSEDVPMKYFYMLYDKLKI